MTAGAPGAFGSLVIFNSSGVTGSHSSPSLMRAQKSIARARKMTASKGRRLGHTMNLRGEAWKTSAEGRFGQNRAAWRMPGRIAPAERDVEGARPLTCATDRCDTPRRTIQRTSTAVNDKEGYE